MVAKDVKPKTEGERISLPASAWIEAIEGHMMNLTLISKIWSVYSTQHFLIFSAPADSLAE